MPVELIEERFVVTGAQQATANYNQMAAGLGSVAKNAAVAQQTLKDGGAGFSNLTNAAKGGAIAFGQLANAAQGIAPAFQGVGAAVVRASGVIGALAGQIGVGGPVAIAVGAATIALGLMSDAFNDNAKEADAAAKAAKKAAAEFGNVANAIAFFQNVRDPGAEFRSKNIKQLEDSIRALRLQLDSPLTDKGLLKDIQIKAEAAQEAAIALRLGTTDPTKTLNDLANPGVAKAAKKTERPETTFGDFAPSSAASEIARIDELIERNKKAQEFLKNLDPEKEAAAGRAAMRRIESQQGLEDAKRNAEEQIRIRDDAAKRETEIEKQKYSTRTALAKEAYGAISGAIAAALSAAIVGEDVSTKQVLKGIGQQAANMGLLNILQAPVDFFWNPPKAAAELAAGTAEVALGAALGAASRGAGGGGGSRGSNAPNLPTFATPSTDSGARNGPVTIINNNNPSIIQPTAHDGKQVQRADFQRRLQGR